MIVLLRKELPPSLLDASTAMADQSASRLLCLPSELRNTIYELLLKQDTSIPPHEQKNINQQRFCANVLQTCKQIHAEASPILYGENTFLAHPNLLTALPAFLLCKLPYAKNTLPPVVHPRVARMIKKFHFLVRLDIDSRYTRDQATACFTGLEVLEVEVFQPSYGTCDFAVLKLLEGVRGVGRAVVGGSVGDGKYARWLEMSMMSPVGAEVSVCRHAEESVGGDQAWDPWTHVSKNQGDVIVETSTLTM